MTLPTDSQWARYSALCAHLQPLPPAARQAQLAAWQDAGTADPQVLSLVALHYALPPDADRDRTGERLGPFTLEAPLGAGGMGIVYRAQQHLGLSTRPVAVKLIHPALLRTAREEALARFQAELGALARLEHEGIARLYDGGIGEDPHTHAPLPYIAMELVRGGLPLTTYARDYALTWPERLALVVRVCHAVRYAHEHRVIHRDLKPANILVDSEGRPVVLDFGLAQACDAVLPGAPLAASGTPAYMSPEQVSAVWGAVSAKSDVYALGLMLYELLTGHHPYAQLCDGSAAQLGHVLTAVMLPPLRQSHPAYGEELEAVLAAALAKRPAERCAVAVLRSRLERYLQQQPPASDRLQADPRPAQQARTGMAVGARPPAAERRQLTILFCDLVDSTTVAGQLDPEDWREVVLAYHATCTGVISRYAGHTAQHLGDGLLVYFGYPAAHEDDAQRAVRTGVEILAALAPLNARLLSSIQARLPHPVQVRIGVHTGVVVIGEIGSSDKREMLALGETPNIAARVQGCAAPDTVVVSAATHRLVHGLFECQELGPQTLKGLATPLLLYRVIAESAAQSRFEVAVGRGLTPLVGREAELSLLRRRWEQAQEGAGQVVLLSGEAGIGKSRLVQTLKEQVSGEQAPRIELRCSPYHQHSAFYPLIDHLQRFLQFAPHDPPQTKLVKLHQALARYRFPHADTLPLLAALLSLPHPAGTPPLPLSPQQQKHKTQEALVAWIIEEAEHAAVYCAWEDLHWADPSSLELLTLYLEHIPTSRVFTVLTFRPDFTPPWGPRSYLMHLTLNRLGRQQVETLVDKVTRGKALPSEVLQQIVAKTDGVPLFVEELTKMVLESGVLQEEEDRYVRAHGQRQGQADGAPIPR
jgi:serine/threonine protein kinase